MRLVAVALVSATTVTRAKQSCHGVGVALLHHAGCGSSSSSASPNRPAYGSSSATPGTSKWKEIEHRLFSFISPNWRGKPLVSHEATINLTASTTTTAQLTVCARLDDRDYDRGLIVSDEQMATINITRDTFHGDWNYQIVPSLASREPSEAVCRVFVADCHARPSRNTRDP